MGYGKKQTSLSRTQLLSLGASGAMGVYKYARSKMGKYLKKRKANTILVAKPKQVVKAKPRLNLKRQVSALSKKVKRNISTHIYRLRTYDACIASANQQNSVSNALLQDAYFDNAIANLRYFDPSNPATLITADIGPSTYQQDINFVKSSVTSTLRNNYQVPCVVRFYLCIPKVDTSLSPLTTWTNGLADQGAPASTNPRVFLTDSDQFHDIWKIYKSVKRTLQPGQQVSISYSAPKPFEYDPSLQDSHSSTYMKQYYACASFVQVSGVVAHDTALDEQGTIGAGVDIINDIVFKIEYNSGGVILNDITVSNTASTFTNGAVVSNKPVADNQAYSLA